MAVEIVYETHSTTVDNEAGIATGWLPGRLSALGRRQAAELGERRRTGGFAAVFTSDLDRAVETARIAFPDGQPPLHQDVRLRECNYGDLNGTPVARIAAQRTRRIDDPFPGGQSYRN
ncbi:histidine phosphatase family protein [Kitasatospora acidiphila]|uniref:Histidine phosphatase family protein n=1 Tax=Kitasatospora acidiphila TaxID=2567942 RepID=A0A540WAW6_9ACTN|nr:histidine phosphatase family protein [Kitasatospora acidiphila]TQF06057.1 histidine phosphatase family protein [Kitasatospora acidiphila]